MYLYGIGKLTLLLLAIVCEMMVCFFLPINVYKNWTNRYPLETFLKGHI